MIGLDTNVLVRYLAQDDAVQSPKANALIESLSTERQGYVTQVVLVEVVWVLSKCYDAQREDIVRIIETLLRTKELAVEASETVWKALRVFASSAADFADCLIERACHDAQCEYTATFDVKTARSAGLKLIR